MIRKIFLIAMLPLLLPAPAAAGSAAEVAKEILTAYKNKDLEGVKKHTSPMIAATMDEKFFEDKEIKADVEALRSWNGKVKEVRYHKTAMGQMAAAYYADADKGNIRTLALINAGYGWKQMGGLSTISKKEFLSYDRKEPEIKAGGEKAGSGKGSAGVLPSGLLKEKLGGMGFGFGGKKKAKASAKPYVAETAEGTKVEGPGEEQLKKMVSAIDGDNFFLTLTAPDGGFMQAAYTDKGLDMQYKDASGHFAGKAPVQAGTAAEMFSSYLKGGDSWKSVCEWKPFE